MKSPTKSMSGDYLWDKSGPRDPDLVRLEQQLSQFGQSELLPPLRMGPERRRARGGAGLAWVLAAAAAVIALIGFVWQVRPSGDPGLQVTRLVGTPTVGSRPVEDQRELPVGRWLETDAGARARLDIGGIGQVEVDPNTRLALLSTRPGDYRLHLERGTMRALIWAPPGQFAVETSSSTAVDLGCAYTLSVDDEGVGRVRVTSGWVGFEWHGRESFIPAGATCVTRPGLGPGTPYFDDVSPEFRAAIEAIDLGVGPPANRAEAIGQALAQARAQDVVTLWHLLTRVDGDSRDLVFDRLAQFVPPPAGVTRDGVRRGRRDMLDDWWDRLGLGTATWWRTWKQNWRDDKPRR
jgi:hypothetical protein